MTFPFRPWVSWVRTVLCVGGLTCTGCESGYYRVTDLESQRVYYTKGSPWLMRHRNGALEFNELSTGDDIVLRSARLTRVTMTEAQQTRAGS